MTKPPAYIDHIEYGVAALLTLAATALHFVVLFNVGDPWRDEVSAIAVASGKNLGEVWSSIHYDSFPLLYFAALHFWIELFSDSTTSLRVLGVCTGLGALGSIWWLGRRFSVGPPLLLLSLVAMSAAVIRYGDSVRAYGFGLIAVAAMLGTIWNLLSECSRKNIAFAAVACVAATHIGYLNSLFLLAIGGTAILVALLCRRWHSAIALSAVCIGTAATVLIYLPATSYQRAMGMLLQSPITAGHVLSVFGETVAMGYGDWIKWLWLALMALAIAAALVSLVTALDQPASEERSVRIARSLFLMLVVPMLGIGFTLFMIWSSYAVRPWYLLPVMLALAGVVEAAMALLPRLPVAARVVRLFVAAVIGVSAVINAPPELKLRATNMPDLITAIEREGGPNDLIIFTDFYASLTFNHLYRGSKAWISIPDLGRHSVHRWDKLKERMQDPQGVTRELELIESTILAGNRVFVIGGFLRLPPNIARTLLPPAPHPVAGWSAGYYMAYWSAQAGAVLASYATNTAVVQPRAPATDVIYWENYPLLVYTRAH